MKSLAAIFQKQEIPFPLGTDFHNRRISLLAKLLLLISCCVVQASQALESESFFKTSYLDMRADAKQAAASSRTLMVMYEQEGCSYCARMHKVNFAQADIRSLLQQRFDVVQLDIWGARELNDFNGHTVSEKQFARDLKIQLSPMINFFDAQGKEIFRIAGYYPPDKFKAALRYVAEGAVARMSFRDYLAQSAGASTAGASALPAEDFFLAADDLAAALRRAREQGKGLAVLFEQAACAPCNEMHEKTLRDPRARAQLRRGYEVVQIHTASPVALTTFDGKRTTQAGLAQALNISVTPTVIFFDGQGHTLFRYDSYRTPEDFYVILLYLTTDARSRYASFQDWLRAEYIPQQRATAARE